jgi:hypothetical protein
LLPFLIRCRFRLMLLKKAFRLTLLKKAAACRRRESISRCSLGKTLSGRTADHARGQGLVP